MVFNAERAINDSKSAFQPCFIAVTSDENVFLIDSDKNSSEVYKKASMKF